MSDRKVKQQAYEMHVVPEDEIDIHERNMSCPCKPAVVMTYYADVQSMVTDITHRRVRTDESGTVAREKVDP